MTFQIKKHHQRYSAYQDTGIPWLGELPEGWKNGRVKNIKAYMYYPIGDGDHGSIKPDMYEESGIPYIRVQNLSWGTDLKDKGLVYIPLDVHRKNMKSCLRPRDILIAKTGATVGKTATIPENITEANTTSSVGKVTVDHKNFDYRYFCYVFRSKQLQEQIWELSIQKSAQPGFNIDDLVDFVIPIPPSRNEQAVIANYLDEKTDILDQTITAKKKQIELLKERRSSLINQAVTRGIEEGVEMKDSEVEWIGEVPNNWQIIKIQNLLKYCYAAIKTGPFGSDLKGSDFLESGEFRVYNQRNVLDNNFEEPAIYISNEKFNELKASEIFEEDVLITTRGTIGKTAIFPRGAKQGILHPCLIRIRVDEKKCLKEFLQLILEHGKYISEQFYLISNATTIEVIYSGTLRATKIILPSVKDQESILKYVGIQTTKIDQIIALVEKSISLLEEYKTSLISNVVTGKIKVS